MGEANRRKAAGGGKGSTAQRFEAFAVGTPIDDKYRKTVPVDGGGCLVLAKGSGLRLITGFPSMNSSEANALRKAPMTVGLLPCGDALFMIVRIEGYATLDLPYDHSIVPPEQRGLPDRLPHQSFDLICVGFDTKTGILRGLRSVSITPEFASVLESEIARLDKRVDAPDWQHQRDVQRAYARWSTPDEMLAAALYQERAGMPFRNEGKYPPVPADAH